MPKRITRTKQQDYKNFRSGFSCGVSAAVFAMQLKTLRLKKGVTIEEAALATNNNPLRLEGLESANLNAYMSLNTDDLFALAKYFDVAIDISFKPQNTFLNPIHDSIQVKTHLEEFGEHNEH